MNMRYQRGLSLVELMVGIAVGLFVVAAATLVTSTQLSSNRRLLLETQVQQDLRATADIMVRELRRNNYSSIAQLMVSNPSIGEAIPSPYATSLSTGPSSVQFDYRRPDAGAGPFGFKLEAGVIKTRMASSGWQELTDRNVLTVSALDFTPTTVSDEKLACPKDCTSGGADSCWPTVKTQDLLITIKGSSVSDPSITRIVQRTIRLRNDRVEFKVTTAVGGFIPCPQ